MKVPTDGTWLFDYDQGMIYEKFSACEDADGEIARYLSANYDFGNEAILEIGAGSGKFTSLLAENCAGLTVVERSASLMLINQEKNATSERIRFIKSDLKNLTFDNNSFDTIFGGWSLTSMRDSFNRILPILDRSLKPNGRIILVENAGGDQFSEIASIVELTAEMREFYASCGFVEKAVLNTVIRLPNQDVFFDAFPVQKASGVVLPSLEIEHKVLILEASAADFDWRG